MCVLVHALGVCACAAAARTGCVRVEGRGQLQLINQLEFLLHFMYLVVRGEGGSAQCASGGQKTVHGSW